MALDSYANLQTAIGSWLNRSDLTSQIPDFITLAEAEFNRVLRHVDMVTKDDAFSVTGRYVNLPTRHLATKRIVLATDPVTRLEFLSVDEMAEKRELDLTATGKPIYYTVVGSQYEFLPSPDSTYTASVVYYQGLAGLATTDPNWLLTSHPDAYLYGALAHSAPFVMDEERVPLWVSRFDRIMAELRADSERKQVGAAPTMRFRSFG